jgi:two-component system nitrogen regulation response regulator GlnG
MTLHEPSLARVDQFITQNAAMARCLKLAVLAAESDVPVLILGETGTGKTLLAQAIHNSSRRAIGPFISFNASAMSETLLESELFGHERGAFTGALKTVKGKFELANAGTLFFDEIADMSPLAQAKVLRAVEYGEFERVGGERALESNARIVSATNCSLRERIRQGRFREDLYHRLNGLTLLIPPLRERVEDMPALIAFELRASAPSLGKNISSIHPDAFDKLLSYAWPGNLRELHHTMRTVALLCDGPVVLPDHVVFESDLTPLPPFQAAPPDPPPQPAGNGSGQTLSRDDLSLATALLDHVRIVYLKAQRNQRQTARLLAISRATLSRYLKKLSLK